MFLAVVAGQSIRSRNCCRVSFIDFSFELFDTPIDKYPRAMSTYVSIDVTSALFTDRYDFWSIECKQNFCTIQFKQLLCITIFLLKTSRRLFFVPFKFYSFDKFYRFSATKTALVNSKELFFWGSVFYEMKYWTRWWKVDWNHWRRTKKRDQFFKTRNKLAEQTLDSVYWFRPRASLPWECGPHCILHWHTHRKKNDIPPVISYPIHDNHRSSYSRVLL